MPQPRRWSDDATRQAAYRERQRAARAAELQAKGLPPAPPISTMPSRQRWHGLFEQARMALQTVHDEQQAYWEDRSEGWQQGDRGEEMSAHIEALEELVAGIEEIAAPYSGQGVRNG